VIDTTEYLEFLRTEYLTDFVARGGAAVKFLVPSNDSEAESLHAGLADIATKSNYVYAYVDAAYYKVHMIDQVFFAVARQIDWEGLSARFLRNSLREIAFPVPEGSEDLTVAGLARHFNYDQGELNRTINQRLQLNLLKDFRMTQEFRVAMLRLCQSMLIDNNAAAVERAAVLEWLRGELRHIAALRSALIFRRIARHNARHMLFSLARWVVRNGYDGLLIDLDIRRCAVAKRGASVLPGDVYYSKAAVMDVYEVLRQLVDATDELSACCVTVTAAPEFLTDDSRGLVTYTALQLRIWDEVRDRRRTNPLSALVRLGDRA
jgi:P-loop Domain of unknown function (DUF2791)